MSNIIRLPGDKHREAQLLLPWYLTGRLDADERARVAAHLKTCAVCRADLRLEQRLGPEFAGLPLDVDQGWAAMRRRLEDDADGAAAGRGGQLGRRAGALARSGAPWMGWALAAGLAAIVAVGALPTAQPPPAAYHTLSSAAPSPAGNVIVIFRPDASESAMRAALQASHARLVDGPTAAGAYVLHAAPAERQRALASLRAATSVVMAEPIDDGAAP